MFLRDTEALGQPVAKLLSYLYLSLSNICNARCTYCDVHSAPAPRGRYGSAEVRTTLREARALGCRTVHFLGGGEPLIDPRFPAAAEACGELALRVVITTNGSHLEQQLRGPLRQAEIDTIVISLDSHCAEHHDRVRGMRGLWERAMAGIRYAQSELPDEARIILNHVVTRDNIAEMGHFLRFASDLGVCAVNFIPVKDRPGLAVAENGAQSMAERFEEAFETARELGMELLCDSGNITGRAVTNSGGVPTREYRCLFPYHALYIDFPSGDAFPCDCTVHRQPQARFTAGNIREQSLAEIWTGEPIEELRRVLESPCDPGCKVDCDWNNVRTNQQLIHVLAAAGRV